jgi:hypothetical protein
MKTTQKRLKKHGKVKSFQIQSNFIALHLKLFAFSLGEFFGEFAVAVSFLLAAFLFEARP